MKKKTQYTIHWEGFEPILTIYKTGPGFKSQHTIGLFFPIRRLKHKIKNHKKYKELKRLGITPQQCQGCGEGWVEFSIEEPNKQLGTKKRINVCEGCVHFYDFKWTHKRLYNTPTDWRDK